jgi:hypothetical protein
MFETFDISHAPTAAKGRFSDFEIDPSSAPTPAAAAPHSDAIHEMQKSLINLGTMIDQYPLFKSFLQANYLKVPLSNLILVGNRGEPDGTWGARTDAGLKDANAVADALASLLAAMGEHLKVKPELDPSVIHGHTPEDHKDLSDPDRVAGLLNQDLVSLMEYYGQIAGVMTKKYGNRLAKDTVITTHRSPGMTEQETGWLASNTNAPLVDKNGNQIRLGNTPMTIGNISSPQAFQELLKSITTPGNEMPDVATQAQWLLGQLGV